MKTTQAGQLLTTAAEIEAQLARCDELQRQAREADLLAPWTEVDRRLYLKHIEDTRMSLYAQMRELASTG